MRLKRFKVLILDGDGVWFTGEEHWIALPSERIAERKSVIAKTRHHHDGQGLTFLRAIGIRILFATSEGEPMASIVNKLNGLPSVKAGTFPKVDLLSGLQKFGTKVHSIEEWLKKEGFEWSDCAYIGDDRTDLEAMQKVLLAVTPANGQRLIKKFADLVLSKDGGRGAIREFAEMVLDERGIDEATLPSA
jgi:YrbI family 3-deoxy-D-manno-octulosonate 8-phosphate phosphatase